MKKKKSDDIKKKIDDKKKDPFNQKQVKKWIFKQIFIFNFFYYK